MAMTLYHNPRCTKSRQTLELLRSNGLEPTVVEYLQSPPSAKELDAILKKLDLEPEAIIRTKEEAYEQSGLKGRIKSLSREEILAILVQYPILIERPILVNGSRAAIGRPPERVLAIL